MTDFLNSSLPTDATSTLPYTTWSPITSMDYSMGILLALCVIFGVSGNAFALKYFSTQRLDVSTYIYLMIVSIDIVNCLLMFSPSISYFRGRHPFLLQYGWICNIWGTVWATTSRLSVFLVAALSISRTISLCLPFRIIRLKNVLIPVAVYSVVLVIGALLPYYYGNQYKYDFVSVLCLWEFVTDISPNGVAFIMIYIFFINVPFLVPFFPIVISCCISVYMLRKGDSAHSEQKLNQCRKRWASRTIVLITLIYILCNFPICIYCTLEITEFIMYYRYGYRQGVIIWNDMNMSYLRLLLAVYSVAINASLNPFVYIFRIKGFKMYSDNLKFRMKNSVQRGSVDVPLKKRRRMLKGGRYTEMKSYREVTTVTDL